MKKCIVAMFGFASLMVMADGYDRKALVEPVTFSCELRNVRLTRVIDRMKIGTTNVTRENESSTDKNTQSSIESSFTESMTGNSSSQHDEEANRTASQFNVGGGIKWGLIPFGKVGGEYSKTGSDESRRSNDKTVSDKRGTSEKNSTATEQIISKGKDITTEKIDESLIGSYRLDFSVALRNRDSKAVRVEGSKMLVSLTSDELPGPVKAKYEERDDFSLGGGQETDCAFKYLIEDWEMLKALLRLKREGRLEQLKLSRSGADIVVKSEETGRNVMSDLNRPGTVFSVEFGELATLPDWRVSHRHSAKSGPRGKRVNISEALRAIQGMAVDKSEDLPEEVFTFADDGSLTMVVDRPLLDRDDEGHYRMFALRLTKNNGETEVCLPNAEIVKAEIADYSKVALFSFGLDEFARVSLISPEYFSRLSSEVEKYLRGCSDQKAYEFYNEALNNPDTLLMLGRCYLNGDGVRKDTGEAVKCFRKAAEQGNAEAQRLLGECYAKGDGVEKNMEEAVRWYRKAAEQGHAAAQFKLGDCYFFGEGVVQDKQEAVKWWRKTAEQGDAAAQYNLGICYINGDGVVQDKQEAVKWWRKAAEQGYAAAQNRLGDCYKNGEGVEQDKQEAVKWYRKAAEQRCEEARQTWEQ